MRLSVKLFPIAFVVSFIIGSLSNFNMNRDVYQYVDVFFLTLLAPFIVFYLIGRRVSFFSDFRAVTISLFSGCLVGFFVGLLLSAIWSLPLINEYFFVNNTLMSVFYYMKIFDLFASFQFIFIFLTGFFGLTIGTEEIIAYVNKVSKLQESNHDIRNMIRLNMKLSVKVVLAALPISFIIGFFSNFYSLSNELPFFQNMPIYYFTMLTLAFIIPSLVFYYIGKSKGMPKFVFALFFSLLSVFIGYFAGFFSSNNIFSQSIELLPFTYSQILFISLVSFFALTVGSQRKKRQELKN
jgi:hypothetical protein